MHNPSLVSDNAAVSNLVIASAGTPTWYSSAAGRNCYQ